MQYRFQEKDDIHSDICLGRVHVPVKNKHFSSLTNAVYSGPEMRGISQFRCPLNLLCKQSYSLHINLKVFPSYLFYEFWHKI